ncbi:uroporphyrinogen-III synthase [Hoeflea sp.]|uniref:uroporphyrinogen-III synthase n=1 Tax=Hoeflea sp. TaxID=1940281 RepID=UPI003B52B7E8
MLVTRPEPGSRRTASRLIGMGHEAVSLPLFEQRITAGPKDLPEPGLIDAVVATSARAFNFLGGTLPAPYRRVPVHAVGPATARAASEAGFATIHEAGGTARELVAFLTRKSDAVKATRGDAANCKADVSPGPAVSESTGQGLRLLYLAGQPRKPLLEQALADAGVSVTVLETYRMAEISYPADFEIDGVFDPPPEVVLLYSANAADRLLDLVTAKNLGKSLLSTRFLCLSTDIRDRLPEAWRDSSIAAERPDEESLLASMAGLG